MEPFRESSAATARWSQSRTMYTITRTFLLALVMSSAALSSLGAQGMRAMHSQGPPATRRWTASKFRRWAASNPLAQQLASSTKQITLKDGDVVSCVALESQPSFAGVSHPVIQKYPTKIPYDSQPRAVKDPWIRLSQQTYALSDKICPLGTYPHRAPTNRTATVVDKDHITNEGSGAWLKRTSQGVHWTANIWEPYVQYPFTYSSMRTLLGLTTNQSSEEPSAIIAVVVQVYEERQGDTRPRLSVWYKNDNDSSWCENLDCPGFVQVSNKVLLGGSMDGVSTSDGIQYEVNLQIFQDVNTSNWWVQVNNEVVGYWPRAVLITSEQHEPVVATWSEWYGEVQAYSPSPDNPFTTTQMGSGAFPEAGFKKAAYMRNLKYISTDMVLIDADAVKIWADSGNCYDVTRQQGRGCRSAPVALPTEEWGANFFFGGPGRNEFCP